MNKQMNTKKKGEINRYMRKVRHLLPTMHKAERRFITNLRQDIEELAQTRPSISYEALVTEFGDPHELVNNYISEKDIDTIRKELHISHVIKVALSFIIVAIVIITTYHLYTTYLVYKDAVKQQIVYDTVVIEEEQTDEEGNTIIQEVTAVSYTHLVCSAACTPSFVLIPAALLLIPVVTTMAKTNMIPVKVFNTFFI